MWTDGRTQVFLPADVGLLGDQPLEFGRMDRFECVADVHFNDVQDHAIEVEENTRTNPDVEAVIAIEWRADYRALSKGSEALHERAPPLGGRHINGAVVLPQPNRCGFKIGLNLGVGGVVKRWTSEPKGFTLNPIHQMPVLNT